MNRGADAWVVDAEPLFEQGLRAAGAEQRDLHRGGHAPAYTEAAGERSVNLAEARCYRSSRKPRGSRPHIGASPPVGMRRYPLDGIIEVRCTGEKKGKGMASCGISRLAAIGFTVVLALWLVVGCAGLQQQSAPPVAGSFVGEVPEADALVAVVAAGPQEAEGGEDEREVRAYLCDGNEINEWFTGTATENDLDLSSDGGSRLEGNLTPDTSTGQITLSDGRTFPFAAELATGVAGLYDVTVTDDGLVHGSSETGGRLEGQVAKEPNEEGSYPVTGTFTASNGQTQEIEAFALDAEPAVGRWVVLNDGQVRGGKRSQSRGFVDPDTQP